MELFKTCMDMHLSAVRTITEYQIGYLKGFRDEYEKRIKSLGSL